MTKKIGLYAVLLTGAVLTAHLPSVVHAATTPAPAEKPARVTPKAEVILSSSDTPMSSVTVMGRRLRSSDEPIRFSRSSASSCAFSPVTSMNSTAAP